MPLRGFFWGFFLLFIHTSFAHHTHLHNNAGTVPLVSADIWQKRCGRIDSVNFELRKAALCFSLEANVILSKAFVPLHLGIRCFSSHAVQQHSMNSVPGENFNLLDVLIALDCPCVSVNVAGQIAHF